MMKDRSLESKGTDLINKDRGDFRLEIKKVGTRKVKAKFQDQYGPVCFQSFSVWTSPVFSCFNTSMLSKHTRKGRQGI